ncbi:hypothetical protein GBAR_LOCUS17557 [Geodia barretti]|uniref:Uncharacterized protein n=1 Tax=Geodia barretti TaxID=519541 RepID=A0AA35SKV2_GEOBA|nr:hypothetical protein GBAR_LOCUS17557 [Geodia barretti]
MCTWMSTYTCMYIWSTDMDEYIHIRTRHTQHVFTVIMIIHVN